MLKFTYCVIIADLEQAVSAVCTPTFSQVYKIY
jgi:hypothetical protein